MVNFRNRFHNVTLIGLNDKSKKILSYYNNVMVLVEYDDLGHPLNIAPNGRQGIFCISPDGFLNTWFILDEDVRFESETKTLDDIMNRVKEAYDPTK